MTGEAERPELQSPRPLSAIGGRQVEGAPVAPDVLDRQLAAQAWLVGDTFTVADLNVACVLSPSRPERLDRTRHARVVDWLARCRARPAAVATRERFAR